MAFSIFLGPKTSFYDIGKVASGAIIVRLELMTDAKHDFLRISVTDPGEGIDPAVLDRLFQPFVTKSESLKATGLGLYLCKAIIEAHGGKIWGNNNPIGKGATFLFTLPLQSNSEWQGLNTPIDERNDQIFRFAREKRTDNASIIWIF